MDGSKFLTKRRIQVLLLDKPTSGKTLKDQFPEVIPLEKIESPSHPVEVVAFPRSHPSAKMRCPQVSYSLNSPKGVMKGIICGSDLGAIEANTRSLDPMFGGVARRAGKQAES